jgi:hypothetical protein
MAIDDDEDADLSSSDAEGDSRAALRLLDEGQYYPTLLPLMDPGAAEVEAEEGDARGAHWRPGDLATTGVGASGGRRALAALLSACIALSLCPSPDPNTHTLQDPEEDTAAGLRLEDAEADEHVYLFQLPSVLPLAPPKTKVKIEDEGAGGGAGGSKARYRQAEAAAAAAAAAPEPAGASLAQLKGRTVGQLLVFESGRVKLRVGDALLDVAAGVPCTARQEVAVINPQPGASSRGGADAPGHLLLLGAVSQRVVVTPDVWQLMEDAEIPEFDGAAAAPAEGRGAAARRRGAAAAAAAAPAAAPKGKVKANGVNGGDHAMEEAQEEEEEEVEGQGAEEEEEEEEAEEDGSDDESSEEESSEEADEDEEEEAAGGRAPMEVDRAGGRQRAAAASAAGAGPSGSGAQRPAAARAGPQRLGGVGAGGGVGRLGSLGSVAGGARAKPALTKRIAAKKDAGGFLD